MNNELRRNAEGYTDPTAAATLNRKEPGDVWTYTNGGRCLIIKNHGKFSTVLQLDDQRKHPNQVEVMTERGPLYADQRLLTYGLHIKMARFVEAVNVEDFKRVITAVENEVGLRLLTTVDVVTTPKEEADSQEVAKLREKVEACEKVAENLRNALYTAKTLKAAAEGDARKAWNQLELLREMYNDLLTKVVGGVVTDGQT